MNAANIDSRDTVTRIILAHPFFKALNPHYLHLWVECASFVQFGPGHDIFREGQQADHFYIISKGSVALETFVPRAGMTTVQIIHEGGVLGCSWLYPPYTWQFSARTIDPVEAVAFGAAGLLEKAEENHDFGYDLLMRAGRVMVETLQNTRHKLVEFYVQDQVG